MTTSLITKYIAIERTENRLKTLSLILLIKLLFYSKVVLDSLTFLTIVSDPSSSQLEKQFFLWRLIDVFPHG